MEVGKKKLSLSLCQDYMERYRIEMVFRTNKANIGSCPSITHATSSASSAPSLSTLQMRAGHLAVEWMKKTGRWKPCALILVTIYKLYDLKKIHQGAGKMAQCVKVLAIKPDDLSLISQVDVVEGEN